MKRPAFSAKNSTLPSDLNHAINARLLKNSVENGEWSIQEVVKQLGSNGMRFILDSKVIVLLLLCINTIYFKAALESHALGKIYMSLLDLFLNTLKESVWPGSDQYIFRKTLGLQFQKHREVLRQLHILKESIGAKDSGYLVQTFPDITEGISYFMTGITFITAFTLAKYPISLFYSYALAKPCTALSRATVCLLLCILVVSAFPLGVVEVIFLIYAFLGVTAGEMMCITFLVRGGSIMTEASWGYVLRNGERELNEMIEALNGHPPADLLKSALLGFVDSLRSTFNDPTYWHYVKPDQLSIGVIFSSAVVVISIILLIPTVLRNLALERQLEEYNTFGLKNDKMKKQVIDDAIHDAHESTA